MTSASRASVGCSSSARRLPVTLWLGLLVMLACEAMLFADVRLSGRGALRTHEQITALLWTYHPQTLFALVAQNIAFNMTPLAWIGYLFFLEGLLTRQQGRSPVRRRPHHFALLCLASIFIWCIFDTINFYSIVAWRYIGMPTDFGERLVGYAIAFGTIVPGMLMSGQAMLNAGWFDWARGRPWHMPRWLPWDSVAIGLAMSLWPIFHHDPITNLTLWGGLVFLIDPINLWRGRPSMFRDWSSGWYGRTLAAFAGGLLCGFLWEFWNYWALTKWVYRLPFLGAAEHIRYFEMPLPGLTGFLPFAMECWVIWQFMRIPLDGLAEPLPDERSLL